MSCFLLIILFCNNIFAFLNIRSVLIISHIVIKPYSTTHEYEISNLQKKIDLQERIDKVIEDAKAEGLKYVSELTNGKECLVFLFENANNERVVRKFSHPNDKNGAKEIKNELGMFKIFKQESNAAKYIIPF